MNTRKGRAQSASPTLDSQFFLFIVTFLLGQLQEMTIYYTQHLVGEALTGQYAMDRLQSAALTGQYAVDRLQFAALTDQYAVDRLQSVPAIVTPRKLRVNLISLLSPAQQNKYAHMQM